MSDRRETDPGGLDPFGADADRSPGAGRRKIVALGDGPGRNRPRSATHPRAAARAKIVRARRAAPADTHSDQNRRSPRRPTRRGDRW